jgi:hypothetical protein
LVAALSVAGCGGDDNDDAASTGPARAETPAAQACPPQTDQILKDAAFRMSHDDFDGAFEVLGEVKDCPRVKDELVVFKARAAKKTLQIAKDQLAKAKRRGGNNASPQPAVSLARNSIRYKDTPEARAFLKVALAELDRFNAKYGPKPAEDGGPPAGAGDGGPPTP